MKNCIDHTLIIAKYIMFVIILLIPRLFYFMWTWLIDKNCVLKSVIKKQKTRNLLSNILEKGQFEIKPAVK